MIGVETLPQKKKGEPWKFDEGACFKVTELLPAITDTPQSTSPTPIISSASRLM